MPRVSVITALYNHEKYCRQAIESVLAQSYKDWEYLIWDDGSKDRSLAIAQEYAEKSGGKIRVFTNPGGANRGQENTRNAAIDHSSGELICLLDSDDFYHPKKLELLVPFFANPKIGLAYGKTEVFVQKLERNFPAPMRREPQGKVFPVLIEENFIGAAAALFRRECVDQAPRFDPTFKTIGEYSVWLKIARDYEFAHVPEVCATWRDHGGNQSTKFALESRRELVVLCERLIKDPSYSKYAVAMSRALARKAYDYASELYRVGELESARAQGFKALAEPHGALSVRAKSAALSSFTFLGPGPNRWIARYKQKFWELRNPVAARAMKSREP